MAVLPLYDSFVPFYPLLDPLEDHCEEGSEFGEVLRRHRPSASSMLELGSGAGHGAHFMKADFERVVLSDLAPAMLRASEQLNPDCEHVLGDMRTLRLDERFDCVFAHDAICHMTTLEELRAAMTTAFVHLVPGGVALFVPDAIEDTFVESHDVQAAEQDGKALRALSWSWDPMPGDGQQQVDYALMLRENGEVRCVHETHRFGLFSHAQWIALLEEVGFVPITEKHTLPPGYEGSGFSDRMYVGLRRE